MAYIYDLSDAWNASGTTFTAIKMNVADTASAAASLLMDLQVGGVSRFNVAPNGTVQFGNAARIGTASANLALAVSSTTLPAVCGASVSNGGEVRVRNTGSFSWSFSTNAPTDYAADLILARDAANTLAQRNGVNAQAFNLYNTYTDASNYERGFMKFVSNTFRIGTEQLGTGTARALEFYVGVTLAADFNTSGLLTVRNGYLYNRSGSTVSVWALQGGVNNFIGNESNQAFSLRTNNANRITMDTVGSVQIVTALVVATLPASPLVGMMARVTDATTPVVGMTVTGGGAAAALCWYNGTNWTVIGV